MHKLTRSMLSSGLALLSIRMICFIWLWLTLLLMQPNTTRALGCREGLYWNANLVTNKKQTHVHVYHSTRMYLVALISALRKFILLCELCPLVEPLAGWDVPHTSLQKANNTSADLS